MVLINKYEVNGTIPYGSLKDVALYKTIIEEYWDNSTYNGDTILRVIPAIYYYGEESSITSAIQSQEVTILIGGSSETDMRSNYENVILEPLEWTELTAIIMRLKLSDYNYNYIDNVTISTTLGMRDENDNVLIRLASSQTTNIFEKYSKYEISESDKQALIDGSAVILSKMIIKNSEDPSQTTILTENDGIKTWEYYDERFIEDTSSFIGEFVAREVKGELQDMTNIFSSNPFESSNTFELRFGIVKFGNGVTIHNYTDSDIHWYSLGDFTITEPTDDAVRDNTSFDAFDSATLLNQPFSYDYTNADFPVSFKTRTENGDYFTALELAKYTCIQYGVIFGNASFTHCDDLITSNQFTTGDSCRDVMKALAKLAYGYCEIRWDNKCYITEMEIDYEHISTKDIITPDHYYSMKTTNEQFGPVNQVRVGMQYIEGQDATVFDTPSILENGLWSLDIMDNPILYTQALRDANATGASRLFGLKFMQFETETIGHPWFKANKPIIIVDMNNVSHITYPFNLILKYNGHIKTTISAPMKTVVDRVESYNSNYFKEIRKIGITVDRQEGLISTINSLTKQNTTDLTSLTTAYEEVISDTYRKEEIKRIVNGTGVDGVKVTKVETNSATFDEEGMTYERLGAKTNTTINEVGVNVKNTNGKSLLFTGYVNDNNTEYPDYKGQTIVATDNIVVRRYLDIGIHSRVQDYKGGTAVYWKG